MTAFHDASELCRLIWLLTGNEQAALRTLEALPSSVSHDLPKPTEVISLCLADGLAQDSRCLQDAQARRLWTYHVSRFIARLSEEELDGLWGNSREDLDELLLANWSSLAAARFQ